MPQCKECGEQFSKRHFVEGQQKILRNRVRCLKCSPFGEYNNRGTTKKLEKCKICGNPLGVRRKTICASCSVVSSRKKKKLQAIEYMGNKCQMCGYNRCEANLVFHHLKPEEKEFQVAGACKSWEKIKAELNKCVMLCHNCHREVHAEKI